MNDRMELHYEIVGSGSPVVAFTHGLAASNGTWRNQVEELSRRYSVLSWDLRGHGQSGSPPGPYRIADLAADLRDVLDDAGVDRAVVVGHSAGGVIAMQFALDHPQRAAGLVLVGTASECNARAYELYEHLATIACERGMDPVRRRLGLRGETDALTPVDPVAFGKIARAMGGLHHEPLTARLGEICCPTLVLVGEKDFLGVGGSVILSRNIPDARLEIVPGRGHGLFLEDPAGFNRLVAAFLDGL